ncbi:MULTISPECIES: hypothetical protein [unclassified Bosea (in: a-proteobacteria)]|uniref:hypothetical protein n=1 Tax=unclassified Bosea (in: a-proteobacteria) TaxID=2653178 RepID=UPI000F75A5AE|nr:MULTISPECIES: hypothetical protein [unclassified Bosea (in: a-proteobacteria)]AZO77523.1 hypothetical protein BLM15_07760 [Bosea sp. Tri-49]RXT18131.1 hypothetical protein B5U98_22925 [Bosea sp. Tri-39]RXT32728.1 hypothetical protein B5U99_29270 [Bosea sp. Tri-54]
MNASTYFIPAFDLTEAREIAYAVHAGRLGHREHYLTREGAEAIRNHLNSLRATKREVFEITVDERVTDDGRIPVAWVVDEIGERAAAIVLFLLIPLVGIASLYEVMA